jgi:hypothetical protein
MAISSQQFYTWQLTNFSSNETDAPGLYCATDRGVFQITNNTVELHGYTFKKAELSYRPTNNEDYSILNILSISRDLYNLM